MFAIAPSRGHELKLSRHKKRPGVLYCPLTGARIETYVFLKSL